MTLLLSWGTNSFTTGNVYKDWADINILPCGSFFGQFRFISGWPELDWPLIEIGKNLDVGPRRCRHVGIRQPSNKRRVQCLAWTRHCRAAETRQKFDEDRRVEAVNVHRSGFRQCFHSRMDADNSDKRFSIKRLKDWACAVC